MEEVFENKEQIEVSRYYERLPKSTSIAIQEMLEGNIYHREPEIVEDVNPSEVDSNSESDSNSDQKKEA